MPNPFSAEGKAQIRSRRRGSNTATPTRPPTEGSPGWGVPHDPATQLPSQWGGTFPGMWDIPPGESNLVQEFGERQPLIPAWAEWLGYQAGQGLYSQFGQEPLSPLEQQAALVAQGFLNPQESPYTQAAGQGLMGLMQPQAPGGAAFAGIADALAPYLQAQQERGRQNLMESLGAAGGFRTGAGQQQLMRYEAEGGQNIAAALAPYAMQGEQLQQQGVLGAAAPLMELGMQPYQLQAQAIPWLSALGAQQYNRPIEMYSQAVPSLLGGLRGGAQPQEDSAGFWDYFIPLASGALSGGAIKF